MKFKFLSLVAILSSCIFPLVPLRADDTLPPGGIKLLPGYIYRPERGTDTLVGEIVKPGGLTIKFDIGMLSGDQTAWEKKQGSCQSYKDQQINHRRVEVALDKEGMFYVTIGGSANFYGKEASQEDMVDVLLMVLTYSDDSPTQQLHPTGNALHPMPPARFGVHERLASQTGVAGKI